MCTDQTQQGSFRWIYSQWCSWSTEQKTLQCPLQKAWTIFTKDTIKTLHLYLYFLSNKQIHNTNVYIVCITMLAAPNRFIAKQTCGAGRVPSPLFLWGRWSLWLTETMPRFKKCQINCPAFIEWAYCSLELFYWFKITF